MEYFVIVLVIALALAPLSHFVPSKHQRKVARLRESAAVQGLFVEFRNLPDGGGTASSGRVARQQDRNIIYYDSCLHFFLPASCQNAFGLSRA